MTERKKGKKKDNSYRFLSVILIVAVLVYAGFQVYRSIFDAMTSELATLHSVYESIETKGIVFRTETVIPAVDSGHVFYTVENGTRVSKGGVIASVYSSPNDGLLEQQIAQIDQQIAALRAMETENATEHLSLELVNTQLMGSVNELVMDSEDRVFNSAEETKSSLLTLLSKKQLITGSKLNLSKTISNLQTKKQALQEGYKKAIASVRAPVAGYFADHTDGYESLLSDVKPASVTVDMLQKLFDAERPETIDSSGKIVGGYEWYMGCIVPETYYNALAVGTDLTLRMTFVTEDEIPVTVVSCKKDNLGNLAVVFRCAYMSEALSTIRNETVEIQLVKHTGLKVSKRAIVINENMDAGVYVRAGNIVSFRKIKQLYSEPADYVICEDAVGDGYLKLYDDIIVEGRGLYEGKIIH